MANTTFIVDTNVVLRFLLKDDEVQSPLAMQYFASTKHDLFIPTLVLCEVIWVMKKTMKLSNSFISEILQNFVMIENIKVNEEEFKNGMAFMNQGGDFADGVIAHHVQDYPDGCLLTFDKKALAVSRKLNLACVEPS